MAADDGVARSLKRERGMAPAGDFRALETGEAEMAHCELAEIDAASFDVADIDAVLEVAEMDDVLLGEEDATTDLLIERGLIYASGRSVAADLVTAHQWFNIAAQRGDKEAARLRREIAAEMSDAEIGAAQRAARDWLKRHPQAPEMTLVLRAAA